MNISITGRHMEVTGSLKDYVQKKVEKVKYYFEHIMNVHVVLEVKKLMHCAEVTIISDERTFFCEVESEDMYESIDKLFDKMERQIRRYRERFTHKGRKSLSENISNVEAHAEDSGELINPITKVKEVAPKPMTEHEAILQLALNDHSFEIFNEEKDNVKESIALKKEKNLFALIQQNNGKWHKRLVKLNNDQLEEVGQEDFEINDVSVDDAISLIEEEKRKYFIFHDPDIDCLNILYWRKNQSLGLLTSGGIV